MSRTEGHTTFQEYCLRLTVPDGGVAFQVLWLHFPSSGTPALDLESSKSHGLAELMG